MLRDVVDFADPLLRVHMSMQIDAILYWIVQPERGKRPCMMLPRILGLNVIRSKTYVPLFFLKWFVVFATDATAGAFQASE